MRTQDYAVRLSVPADLCEAAFVVSTMVPRLTVKSVFVLVAICFSATAFAQSEPPRVGGKPLFQVKPKEPMGCKRVGTVKGTKLWAGDCLGLEIRGSTTTTEPQALLERATAVMPPGQKE
jgi:hypothetical protein